MQNILLDWLKTIKHSSKYSSQKEVDANGEYRFEQIWHYRSN